MSLEASTLHVKVESAGITQATDALNKLAAAGDKAEKSTAKLAKAGSGAEASAKKQERVWYELLDKVSKAQEREYNALQRHNNRVYGLMQAEANKLNKEFDRKIKQEQEGYAKLQREADRHYARKAAEEARNYKKLQNQADQYYKQRERDAVAALKRETDALARAEADAARKLERQRALNASYSSSGMSAQISTLQNASAYAALGGNVANRFGSNVAGALGSGELQRLQQQYRQLGEEAKRTNSIMSDTHSAVRGLSGSLGALWLTYGNLIPLLAGAAIGAGLREAVTGFANVEYQMTFVKGLTEDTTLSVKKLSDEMHNVAKALGIAPEEAAKGLRALAQAGLSTQDALKNLPQIFKVATVGELPLETAALALTGVANAYGIAYDQLEHVGDVMAKAGAMSATSVSAMSESMKYAAGTAEQYGVSLEKLGTILTLLGKRTITGSSAGVAANNLIAEIYSPSSLKAIKAQAALGVQTYADGVRVELDKVIAQMKTSLGKFDAESQGKILEDWFGKKAGKGFYAIANADHKEFMEIEKDLRESTGFTAKVFADSQQTMRGQMDLTKATITNTFATIGETTAEPIKNLMRGIRQAFESDALKDALIGFSQSITTMVTVVGPLAVAYAGLWTAMKVGTVVVPLLVRSFALLNFSAIATGVMGAYSAIMKFGTALATMNVAALAANPIAIALVGAVTLLAGAYFLLKKNKESALDLHAKEMENSREVQKNLEKENKLLEDKLKLQRQGVNEDQMEAALRGLAGEEAVDKISKEIEANKKRIQELNNMGVQRSDTAEGRRQLDINRLTKQQKELGNALSEQVDQNKVNADLERKRAEFSRQYMENARKIREQAEVPQATGNKSYGGDKSEEEAAKKQIKFVDAERLEMNKLIATYEAKNNAMKQAFENGKMYAAETQAAIVKENLLAGKYGKDRTEQNKQYQEQLALANKVDSSKFENERLKKLNEFSTKLYELEAGQKSFNTVAIDGASMHMGALRKEAEGIIQNISLTKEQAEALRKRADVADEYKRQQETIVKLETAATSAGQRAEAALEEAQAMAKYGEVTKLTAMQVAELTIQKMRLTDAGSEAAKSALREAAATEQLNTAYRELMKQQIDIGKKLEEAQAESKMVFADSEAAKVKIATESRNKIVKMELEKAEAAYQSKLASGTATGGDYSALVEARIAANKSITDNEQLGIVETNNLRLKEWKKTVDSIEQIGREGFYSLTEKGVNIWSSMGRTFKNMFKTTVMDYIYKQFAKPLILNVVASLAGFIGADGLAAAANAMAGGGEGKEGAAGGGTGILGAIGTAKSIYSAITGGFAGIGESVTAAIDYLAGPGVIGAESAPSAFATGAGTVASYAAGILGGHFVGRGISNGYSAFGGSGNSAVNVATAIGAVAGGPLGAFLGGAIGGLVNKAFGHRAKEIQREGIRGTITETGTTGESFADWKKEGGWFRSDKRGTDRAALPNEIINTFASGLTTLKTSSIEFAKTLGVNSNVLDNYTKSFNIMFGKDAAANQEAVSKFFVEMADDMATRLIPNIMQFAKQGETASVVLQRLSETFAATKTVADILGKSVAEIFGSDGIASANARTKLIDMSGGASALTQKTAGYVSAIYTDAQKLAPVQRALSEAMTSLGLASVKTKEQFKAVVDGLNLTNEADIKLFNSLMELAPAFGQITDAAESITSSARDSLTEAYNREADAIKSTMERMQDFAKGLKELRDSALLGSLSPLTPQQKYLESKAQFDKIANAAKGGDEKALEQFDSAYKAFLEASQVANASGSQYQNDFAYAQNLAMEASKWVEKQVSTAQANLDALNKQVDGLLKVDAGLKTVTQAIQELTTAMGGDSKALATKNNKVAIESLYQSLLGRSADDAGMGFWLDTMGKGASIGEIAKQISNSPEALGRDFSSVTPATSYSGSPEMVVELRAVKEELNKANELAVSLNEELKTLREEQDKQTGALAETQLAVAEIIGKRLLDTGKEIAKANARNFESKAALDE